MSKNQVVISASVPIEVRDKLRLMANNKDVFVSELIRQSLGWEEVEIFPNTLNSKYDMDLLSNMSVSELPLNFAIERIDEMLEKVSKPNKVKTLEWIKRRYTWVYENLKMVNMEFIDQIDDENVIIMGEYYNAFLDFINKTNKTKENRKKFIEGCK